MVMVMTTLEQKIASALADDSITSTALDELITEVETAIVAADKDAEAEREKALNPLASPDAAKAHEAMQMVEFNRDRLRTVLPRLQQRFSEVRSKEEYVRWVMDHEQVRAKRDAAAEELKVIYPEFEAKLVGLLLRIEEVDREVRRVNSAKPFDAKEANGDGRWLLETELVARGLDHFRIHDLQIMRDLKLPQFEAGAQLAWPPHRPIDWSSVAPVARHPGADWAVEREERAAATRVDQERVIEHYAAMARQREKSEADEAQKRGKGAAA
jgi:hypothetical protein